METGEEVLGEQEMLLVSSSSWLARESTSGNIAAISVTRQLWSVHFLLLCSSRKSRKKHVVGQAPHDSFQRLNRNTVGCYLVTGHISSRCCRELILLLCSVVHHIPSPISPIHRNTKDTWIEIEKRGYQT